MLLRARCCYGKSSVHQSLRLSVTLRYRDHIHCTLEIFENNSMADYRRLSSLLQTPNITDQCQREHPELWLEYGRGMGKVAFSGVLLLGSV